MDEIIKDYCPECKKETELIWHERFVGFYNQTGIHNGYYECNECGYKIYV